MKPSLQDKIDRDLALNLTEIMAATGYGRSAIKRIKPPLVCGKVRLSDFWKHHAKLGQKEMNGAAVVPNITTTVASLEPPNNLQSIVDRMRAPRPIRHR